MGAENHLGCRTGDFRSPGKAIQKTCEYKKRLSAGESRKALSFTSAGEQIKPEAVKKL